MDSKLNWFELHILAVAFHWPLALAVAAVALLLAFGFSNSKPYRFLSIVAVLVSIGPLLTVCIFVMSCRKFVFNS
ncbi:hypothetical protein RMR16_024860 (plasmid) [Agrobacterium sp. rho-13.3]|uniref:hypothetical protein n=1 Tax=Agrobacterium sp. rho-13.3 TaxID=3072980 RepID=UPI002A167B66|nr:hypothetical protein [Agrobacterium sp. rho-13.3]MDX8310184.1 hypothetical protein [Agrobacterium sp. rho-13.3]